ncbi:glycoside hydrolase family 16 protein [Marinimicrobium alkaliphilum]|uniref:glycoside hydrolase family 16 protein n=1 Tax=Marinimicrobium alkaliphilum TaxID=2202654 RepID=UPI0013001ED0|nr:glycoside hydrolase family 16 protein [Marinimicrobium alkaliphilum]
MKSMMKNAVGLTALALILGGCGASSEVRPPARDGNNNGGDASSSSSSVAPPETYEWELVWSDDFEGDSIDLDKWSHEVNCWGGGNNELQCYTDREENSYVEDGTLYLVAREESFSGPGVTDDDPNYNPDDQSVTRQYTSARLRTKDKGDWKYGRIEVSAKMPQGQGLWPAIWMLPTENVHGTWPLSGEIDIFEAVNTNASGGNEIHGTLHYGRMWPDNVYTGAAYEPDMPIWEEFHTYAIEWEEGEIRWYVDDIHYATQTDDGWFTFYWGGQEQGFQLGEGAAPFDEVFHLILNVAVGGNWPGNPDAETTFPQMMAVDYVRVYQCPAEDGTGRGCATNVDDGVMVSGDGGTLRSYSLYDDGDASVRVRAYDMNFDIDLVPSAWEESPGNLVMDPALETDHGTVWDIQYNGPSNAFLLTEDLSEREYLEDGLSFNGVEAGGQIKFDLRVVDIEDETELLVKVDSGWPNVSYHSIDIPGNDEWVTVAVRFSEMVGTDTGDQSGAVIYNDIVAPFVVEAVGGTAHIQINNVSIDCLDPCAVDPQLDGTVPEGIEGMDIFVDGALVAPWDNPGVGRYEEAGQVIDWGIVSDSELGDVLQFSFGSGFGTIYLQSETAQNLSSYQGGSLQFDLKVVDLGNNTEGFLVKADCIYPCGSVEIPVDAPPVGEWETISIPISALSGLQLQRVDVPISIFPRINHQNGVVFRLANVRWVVGND